MLLERCSLARLVCAKVDVFGAKPTNRHNHRLPKSEKPISFFLETNFFLYVKYVSMKRHRMIHELCTLLQEIVFWLLVIKKVPTNMVSFLTGYCAVGIFSFQMYTPVSSLYNSWSGIMCYTTMKGALW
jgi:hypothetical protein